MQKSLKEEDMLETAIGFHHTEQYAEAMEQYKIILKKDPNNATCWTNLGTIYRKLGYLEASLACSEKALEFNPKNPSYLTNYGNILTDLDRREEAISAHMKALRLCPDNLLICKNLANSLREFCHFEQALNHYKKAHQIEPNNNHIKWDLAITYLHLGRYEDGWKYFESRWEIGEIRDRPIEAPKWNGEPLEEKTILIHGEQGFGDTILCSRYIPMVKMCGAKKIIFECQKPLHKLFSSIYGIDHIEEYGQTKESFDYQISIMSLPGIFNTDLNSIPPTPELFIPNKLPHNARSLLNAAENKFKVGIVWSGSVTFKGNKKRAVSIKNFLPLASIPGVQLYSLQKGPCEKELYEAGADALIWDLSNDLGDFTDTAAILSELDLVIMTDSSVAHLAGSIGCPIWNLLCYKPYWLYLTYREDCPWYSSMRLMRQKEPGNWEDVFAKVATELEKAVLMKKAGIWQKMKEENKRNCKELAA